MDSVSDSSSGPFRSPHVERAVHMDSDLNEESERSLSVPQRTILPGLSHPDADPSGVVGVPTEEWEEWDDENWNDQVRPVPIWMLFFFLMSFIGMVVGIAKEDVFEANKVVYGYFQFCDRSFGGRDCRKYEDCGGNSAACSNIETAMGLGASAVILYGIMMSIAVYMALRVSMDRADVRVMLAGVVLFAVPGPMLALGLLFVKNTVEELQDESEPHSVFFVVCGAALLSLFSTFMCCSARNGVRRYQKRTTSVVPTTDGTAEQPTPLNADQTV